MLPMSPLCKVCEQRNNSSPSQHSNTERKESTCQALARHTSFHTTVCGPHRLIGQQHRPLTAKHASTLVLCPLESGGNLVGQACWWIHCFVCGGGVALGIVDEQEKVKVASVGFLLIRCTLRKRKKKEKGGKRW